jgi:hypothetical protein
MPSVGARLGSDERVEQVLFECGETSEVHADMDAAVHAGSGVSHVTPEAKDCGRDLELEHDPVDCGLFGGGVEELDTGAVSGDIEDSALTPSLATAAFEHVSGRLAERAAQRRSGAQSARGAVAPYRPVPHHHQDGRHVLRST